MKKPKNTEAANTYWFAVGALLHTHTAAITVDRFTIMQPKINKALMKTHCLFTWAADSLTCSLLESIQLIGSETKGSRPIAPIVAKSEI